MRAFAILALAGLAACSPPAAPDPRSVLTRAQLDQVDQPLILVEIPALSVAATLVPVSRNGDVVTWQTGDQVSVSIRGGVIVATRGLGADLMSADAPGSIALANGGGPGGTYTRFHTFLDGENQVQYQAFNCRLRGRVREAIEIIGQRHDTLRTDETCFTEGFVAENIYWRGGDGTLWKSRQWLGHVTGYVTMERLKK
ncbi:MAG: YjbF family lipoprotein [Rhodobacteraceae bacterium]|nr:MAG: YjbF family lipoprotein [Paracoccaceae bacterium]